MGGGGTDSEMKGCSSRDKGVWSYSREVVTEEEHDSIECGVAYTRELQETTISENKRKGGRAGDEASGLNVEL